MNPIRPTLRVLNSGGKFVLNHWKGVLVGIALVLVVGRVLHIL